MVRKYRLLITDRSLPLPVLTVSKPAVQSGLRPGSGLAPDIQGQRPNREHSFQSFSKADGNA